MTVFDGVDPALPDEDDSSVTMGAEWADEARTLLIRWDRRGTRDHAGAYLDAAIRLLREAVGDDRPRPAS